MLNLSEYWSSTRERCGVILKSGEVVELTNQSETPETDFVIGAEDLEGLDVAATWHTHCHDSANLSTPDYVAFLARPNWFHYIATENEVWCYYVRDGKVLVYENDDNENPDV